MEPLKMPFRLTGALITTSINRIRRGPARPSWSFGFEVMARTLRATGLSIGTRPPLAQREAWLQMGRSQPNRLRKEITVEHVDADGVPAQWVTPHGVSDDAPVLVYLHGGGYRYGSWETHGEMVSRIARAAGARALFVEYRLCPEHPFPAAVDDSVAATRWVLQRTPAHRVIVGGDSAGGTLTLAVLLTLRDAGEALPAAGVCLSPWVDPRERGGSMKSNAPYDWAAPEEFDDWVRTYVDESQLDDPRVAPIRARLRGLPPLLIQVGSAEMLHDQVVAFAHKAKDEGVDVSLSVAPDMVHDWHTLASMFTQSQQSIHECGNYIRTRTTPSSVLVTA